VQGFLFFALISPLHIVRLTGKSDLRQAYSVCPTNLSNPSQNLGYASAPKPTSGQTLTAPIKPHTTDSPHTALPSLWQRFLLKTTLESPLRQSSAMDRLTARLPYIPRRGGKAHYQSPGRARAYSRTKTKMSYSICRTVECFFWGGRTLVRLQVSTMMSSMMIVLNHCTGIVPSTVRLRSMYSLLGTGALSAHRYVPTRRCRPPVPASICLLLTKLKTLTFCLKP
jgi:hypothetical protein